MSTTTNTTVTSAHVHAVAKAMRKVRKAEAGTNRTWATELGAAVHSAVQDGHLTLADLARDLRATDPKAAASKGYLSRAGTVYRVLVSEGVDVAALATYSQALMYAAAQEVDAGKLPLDGVLDALAEGIVSGPERKGASTKRGAATGTDTGTLTPEASEDLRHLRAVTGQSAEELASLAIRVLRAAQVGADADGQPDVLAWVQGRAAAAVRRSGRKGA